MNALRNLLSNFIHFQDLKSNCFSFTPLGSGIVGIAPGSNQADHLLAKAWSNDNSSRAMELNASCGCSCS